MNLNKNQFDMSRILALDGIRGIAFLVVLFCHTHPQLFPGGNFGVDLFFVLSGFLITSILLQEIRLTGRIDIVHFYIRRALRLLPALFLMVLSVIIYTYFAQPDQFSLVISDAYQIALYIYNWRLSFDSLNALHLHPIMFRHLWSLSIEEQFYIVWPWILMILQRLPRSLVLVILFLGIGVPAIARSILWEEGASYWIYFRTDLRFDNMLYGVFLAWLLHWKWVPSTRIKFFLSWIGPLALIGFLLFSRYNLISNGYAYKGAISAVSLLSVLLIASTIISPLSYLKQFLELKSLRYVGKLSYGLYLWHLPVGIMVAEISNVWVRNFVLIFATFLIAMISYYIFELPFLRMKYKIGRKLHENFVPLNSF